MSALATAARVTVLLAAGAFAGALPVAAAPAVEPEETHQTEGRQDLALWKLANFVLLAGIAGYFIYKKGGAFFTARTAQIRRGLEEAAQARQDAEARYAEMERRLANLAVEIEGLREQAHQESSSESERVRREIERELKKIQEQAEQDISTAAKVARQNLRAYSADLAVALAARQIRRQLTPETEDTLVEAMVTQLARRFEDQAVRAS